MRPFLALIQKQLFDTRWLLGISATALFAMSWLTVWVTSLTEERARVEGRGGLVRLATRVISQESAQDLPSVAFEMFWWNHPFILLNVLLWAIARGSIGVAGEIERGTLDLILSRPVSRGSYLASQALVALFGLAVLAGSMVTGNLAANAFNPVETPATLVVLTRPALNLVALGLAVYGYTLLFSAVDSVRWRPNLIGSVLTLAGFIVLVIANIPVLENWKWVGKFSIFKAYEPISAAVSGKDLPFNAGVLGGLGLGCMALAFWAFQARDLPANS